MAEQLLIIDYFDSLIDEVDFKTEKIITQFPHCKEVINQKRQLLIDEIESIKTYNLNEAIKQGHVSSLSKERLFKQFCFIVDRYDTDLRCYSSVECQQSAEYTETIIDESLGHLIVMQDGYLSERKLSLFKELLCYGNTIQQQHPAHRNDFTKCDKFFKRIENCAHLHTFQSNIFESNLKIMVILTDI